MTHCTMSVCYTMELHLTPSINNKLCAEIILSINKTLEVTDMLYMSIDKLFNELDTEYNN